MDPRFLAQCPDSEVQEAWCRLALERSLFKSFLTFNWVLTVFSFPSHTPAAVTSCRNGRPAISSVLHGLASRQADLEIEQFNLFKSQNLVFETSPLFRRS